MWAVVAGVIPRPPVTAMCFFMFLGSRSQMFFNTTNVVSGAQNIFNYRGTIVDIMKGFLALSGAVSILVYDIFCGGNPTNFLLMLALLPMFISLLLIFLVSTYETTSTIDDKKHLNAFLPLL
nr:uncharacterized protein LOC107434206 [Ziziphus jujuba var. spinosa]